MLHLVPRAIGGWVAGCGEREERSRENLTVEKIGRRNCKIASRSSYPCGWRFCANPVRPDPRQTFEKLCYTWFHVRMGAGSLDVVKGRRGRAKTSLWKELEGGIARSHRDLTIHGVKCCASLWNPKKSTGNYSGTRMHGLWGAWGCVVKRRIRCRKKEAVTRSGGRNCKFPPRSNYSWGQMLGQPLKS